MRNYKNISSFVRLHYKYSLIKTCKLAGLIVGISQTLFTTESYLKFSGSKPINIFEPFIQNFMSFPCVTIMLAGLIIAMSDAPFINSNMMMSVYRGRKSDWYDSVWIYIVISTNMYYLVSFMVSCLAAVFKGYTVDQWSEPFRNLGRAGLRAAGIFHLQIPDDYLIEYLSPCYVFINTYLCIMLYSLLLLSIMFVFNLSGDSKAGTAIAVCVHIIGVSMYSLQFLSPIFGRWFPLCNAVFTWHYGSGIPALFSYAFFILLIASVYYTGKIRIKHMDFSI